MKKISRRNALKSTLFPPQEVFGIRKISPDLFSAFTMLSAMPPTIF